MGVQGLWEILQPTGQCRSLAHLAVVDGFENNSSGRRALRVGIDASLWYQHASAFVRGAKRDIGANPDIRCLFFRLCNLSELPILPLFVFDGRQRPKMKRGSKKGKSGSHNMTQKMKEMLNVFGMEWRMALGEAEAELGYLNRVGVIDAIMTDDADAFLFGAQTIIRNASLHLSGNRSDPAVNLDGKASQHHVKIFTADIIRNHPGVRLTRGGMILIALLSGGDYDHGISNCGPNIAHGLALCGFGDQLLNAYECGNGHFQAFLPRWRAEVAQELRTNSQGKFETRHPGIGIPDTFPDSAVMEAYANPICSGRNDQESGVAMRDKGDLSLSQAAGFCEAHFDEWGHRSAIVKRFRDLLWNSAVMNVLRRAALEADEKERSKRVAQGQRDLHIRRPLTPSPDDAVGAPASLVNRYLNAAVVDPYADIFVNRGSQPAASSSTADPYPLFKEIVGSRTHVSTDRMLEYRVVVSPRQLVDLVHRGIKGKHAEPPQTDSQNLPDADGIYGGTPKRTPKKPPPDPYSEMRLWLPASMMRQVHPRLVEEYEHAQQAKEARKAGGGRGRGKRRAASLDSDDESESEPEATQSSSQPTPSRTSRQSVRRSTTSSQNSADVTLNATPRPSRQAIELPRRTFRNVGLINSELPPSGQAFLFTFTNPDDPDVIDRDDDDEFGAAEGPGLSVTNNNIPDTSRGPSAKGKQKEMHTPLAEDDGDDDWELPPLPSSQLDQYNDMFDRILGIAPSQPKAKGTTARAMKPAVPRTRPRAQAASSAQGSRTDIVQRKTVQSSSSRPSPPSVPTVPKRTTAVLAKQKQARAPVAEDDDDWELPLLPPSQLDKHNDMFDRILGIAPSQSKARSDATRTTKPAASRKRPRPPTALSTADSRTESVQRTKKQKTVQPSSSSAPRPVIPTVPQEAPAVAFATAPTHTGSQRRPAPFPDLFPFDQPYVASHGVPAQRSSEVKSRTAPARTVPSRLPGYSSSSQESGMGTFLADVMVFKDLTAGKRSAKS